MRLGDYEMVAGRQRDFDIDEALKKAMYVFWQKGYLGASLTELTTCMGINKPSMYAAFGNKEDLFVAAADYYSKHFATPLLDYLVEENRDLSSRVRTYLRSTAELLCDDKTPQGCFLAVVTNELAAHTLPRKAQDVVTSNANCSEEYFEAYFTEEKAQGHIEASANLKDLSLYMMTVLYGQGAMARNGKPIEQLYKTIDIAMLGFADVII